MAERSVKITKREHFQIMCQVFDDVTNNEEYKNEKVKEALVVFSNKVHQKIFSPQKERLAISARVKRITTEVLQGNE